MRKFSKICLEPTRSGIIFSAPILTHSIVLHGDGGAITRRRIGWDIMRLGLEFPMLEQLLKLLPFLERGMILLSDFNV